jgi:hypothetical protein
VFIILKEALAKEATKRTATENRLIRSFATYIQQHRTYLAEQALGMYDAWKTSDDAFRASTGQSKSWSALFYYGTVPLDFQGTLSGLMGLGASGGGVAGALVAANQFFNGFEWKDGTNGLKVVKFRTQMTGVLRSLQTLKSAQGLAAVSGATVIQVAFAILSSIAIDQFIAIESARPELAAALSEAREPVNLDVLAASDNGEDMLYLYWARAMDTTDPEDAQVLQLAAMAQVNAEQSGYAAPPKVYDVVPPTTDTLASGTTSGYLNQSEKLVSNNGMYEAEMQGDGNFVIYAANRQPVWATGTNGKGTAPYKLAMQADGSLVVVGGSGSSIWTTGVRAGTAPYKLIMQDDGNLVIYDNSNRAFWATGTNR